MAEINHFFRIEISPDGMTAHTIRLDSGAKVPTLDDLKNALVKAGVRYGIDEEALKTAMNSPPGAKTFIASGAPPKPGCDAVIHLKETPTKKSAPKLLLDGKVDYKDMQLVKNVVKGQVIAEKEPAIAGMPGMTVKRVPVDPPPIKDPQLEAGPNTAVTPDGLKLLSLIDGHLVIESMGLGRQEIRVDKTFVLKRSVDMATGNIYCIGNCEVRGNVTEGFKVVAQGDIKILGSVEGAEVTSHGGNVEISKGLIGQGKAVIRALHDVKANFIENAVIETGGNVVVEEHIMHSKIFSAGGVYIEGKPGALIGGETSFVTKMKVRQIGSEANPKTKFYMGNWIARSALQRIAELSKTLSELNIQYQTAQTAFNKMRQLTMEDPSAYAAEIETLKTVSAPLANLSDRIKAINEEISVLQKKIIPMENKPVIEVLETLFSGVVIEGEEFDEIIFKNNRRSIKLTIGEGPDGKVGLRVRQLRG